MNPSQDAIVRKNIHWDFPYLGDIERRTLLALINTHPSYDVAEPLTPNTIPVGGLQIQPAKPLPKVINVCFVFLFDWFLTYSAFLNRT